MEVVPSHRNMLSLTLKISCPEELIIFHSVIWDKEFLLGVLVQVYIQNAEYRI